MSDEKKPNRIFQAEKEVDLSFFGYEKPAIVKRLTAGEKKKLENDISMANRVRVKGNEVIADPSPGGMSMLYALAYYKDGPLVKSKEAFEAVDWEVISLIEDAGDELNNPFVTPVISEPSSEQDKPSSTETQQATQ